MTLEQTQQLGVEFERRLIEMDPSFEVENKVDTETIYKFLNQYCQQYVQTLMIQLIQSSKTNPNAIPVIQEKLRTLIKKEVCRKSKVTESQIFEDYKYCNIFELPSNYYQYISSVSICTTSYEHPNETVIPQIGGTPKISTHSLLNTVCSEHDINTIIDSVSNDGFIMRHPAVVLESTVDDLDVANNIKVFHDKYTKIKHLVMTYYSFPADFSILPGQESPCELSYNAFWDIVKGAVDLYIYTYKYGITLENLKRRAKEQARNERDANRRNREDEE